MDVQAIWHLADMYSKTEAEKWCTEHGFSTDIYRARKDDGVVTHHIHAQFDTAEAVEGSWRTLSDDFPDGISVSVCERKKDKFAGTTTIAHNIDCLINQINEVLYGKRLLRLRTSEGDKR